MHYTTRLIFLAALCGLTAHAQIIKSNVFTRKDLTSAANKAAARALLGISEWVTNSVPSYTNIVQSYTNIVADLTALAAYSGASTLVLVTDALRGGAFRYEATGYTADGGVVIDATTGKGSGAWVRQCDTNAVYARWWAADRTDLGAALRSARAKGLSERQVLWKHVFRNALIPIVTGFPAAFIGAFFTGALLIETLFSLDGLGLLSYESVIRRDYPVVLGTLYLFTLIGLITKLISDLTYVWVDPRVKFD